MLLHSVLKEGYQLCPKTNIYEPIRNLSLGSENLCSDRSSRKGYFTNVHIHTDVCTASRCKMLWGCDKTV